MQVRSSILTFRSARFLTSLTTTSSPRFNEKNKGSQGSPEDRRDVSLERNFITPVRAMSDFLLKSGDLQGLRKTMRRSPHTDEPPITVYWRKDVEAK